MNASRLRLRSMRLAVLPAQLTDSVGTTIRREPAVFFRDGPVRPRVLFSILLEAPAAATVAAATGATGVAWC